MQIERINLPYDDETYYSWLTRRFPEIAKELINLSPRDENYLKLNISDDTKRYVSKSTGLSLSCINKLLNTSSSWIVNDREQLRNFCWPCWQGDIYYGRTPYWRKVWTNVWYTRCEHHYSRLVSPILFGSSAPKTAVDEYYLYRDEVSESFLYNRKEDLLPDGEQLKRHKYRNLKDLSFCAYSFSLQRAIFRLIRSGSVEVMNRTIEVDINDFFRALSDLAFLLARSCDRIPFLLDYGLVARFVLKYKSHRSFFILRDKAELVGAENTLAINFSNYPLIVREATFEMIAVLIGLRPRLYYRRLPKHRYFSEFGDFLSVEDMWKRTCDSLVYGHDYVNWLVERRKFWPVELQTLLNYDLV